jgi:hypothetical protein
VVAVPVSEDDGTVDFEELVGFFLQGCALALGGKVLAERNLDAPVAGTLLAMAEPGDDWNEELAGVLEPTDKFLFRPVAEACSRGRAVPCA